MTPTQTDYWRDAIAMACVDNLTPAAIFTAVNLAHTGEAFNAAIHAAVQLQDITRNAKTP